MPERASTTRSLTLISTFSAAILLVAMTGVAARAQTAPPTGKPEMAENCPGLIASRPDAATSRLAFGPLPPLVPAAFRTVALNAGEVRLSYVGHSTFMIESPGGVRIATDYNDYVRPRVVPDIATMNHAHSTHYTDHPDPAIKHVLRGWSDDEKPARYDISVGDVRVRNVPTNIRGYGGDTERHGNSIFVFEIANLCIAHLGHLHHTLTQQQLNEIGRIDVVMVPVDGTYTLDLDGMVEVVTALKAQIVIPMHYFSRYTLGRFLDRVGAHFDIETQEVPTTVVSKATMPAKPKVLVLPGY